VQEKRRELFPQEKKVVNEAILLDQQSTTMSCLLELPAAFGKCCVLLKGLSVLVYMHLFRSVLVFFGIGQVQELNIQLLQGLHGELVPLTLYNISSFQASL